MAWFSGSSDRVAGGLCHPAQSKSSAAERRVLVVDADADAAGRSASILTTAGFTVVAQARDPQTAGVLVEECRPRVVCLHLGGWSASVLALFSGFFPAVRVLVQADAPSLATVLACLDAGAAGFVNRTDGWVDLARHVEATACGLAPFTPDVAALLVPILCHRGEPSAAADVVPTPSKDTRRPMLTPRERELLSLLAAGRNYGDIATDLGISIGTVQTHVKNLYRKLEVSSKVAAVTLGLRGGLVSMSALDSPSSFVGGVGSSRANDSVRSRAGGSSHEVEVAAGVAARCVTGAVARSRPGECRQGRSSMTDTRTGRPGGGIVKSVGKSRRQSPTRG